MSDAVDDAARDVVLSAVRPTVGAVRPGWTVTEIHASARAILDAEVTRLVAAGATDPQIARALDWSPSSVRRPAQGERDQ